MARMSYSLSTTFSDSHKLDLRYRPFLAGFRRLLDISQHWQPIWVNRKIIFSIFLRIIYIMKNMWYIGIMQERITTTNKGSITSVQAVYVPADDLTDPAPAATFAHLDATTVLSRPIAELGIYPAVDPLDSTSRILDPQVVGEDHYNTARGVQKILQSYKSLQVLKLICCPIQINKILNIYFNH